MNSLIGIIAGVISLKMLLNTYMGKINMNNDITNYSPKDIVNPVKTVEINNNYVNDYIFLSNINHCPSNYNSHLNKIFSGKQMQLPGYTSNDYYDLTRYNNNKYKDPQPINI